MAEELPQPKNRKEEFLANIAGMDVALPEPANREEIYLNAIAENGGGGGGGSYVAGDGINIADNTISVDTDTIQEKLTAGDGIGIVNDIISATNTGKARELTTDDYNYPTNNPSSVALWLLDPGHYFAKSGVTVRISTSTVESQGNYLVGQTSSSNKKNIVYFYGSLVGGRSALVGATDGAEWENVSLTTSVINNLTSTSTTSALSAKQGKVLKDLIDSLVIKNAGAPTTATVGTVGMLYEDTTNGKLYQCTDTTGGVYTWTEVGGSAGPTVVQTTGNSTINVMSQNATTGMVFSDPSSRTSVRIGNTNPAGSSYGVSIGRDAYLSASADYGVVLGNQATSNWSGNVALGAFSGTNSIFDAVGEVAINSTNSNYGYNHSHYRLLRGLYDPQNAHDAATKGYVDGLVGNVASALNVINNGTGA